MIMEMINIFTRECVQDSCFAQLLIPKDNLIN